MSESLVRRVEHDLSEKLGLEDHAACACAIQNFMLSLAEEGIGSKWMTGALGAAPEDVMAAVGAPAGEQLGRDLVPLPGEGFGGGREGAAAQEGPRRRPDGVPLGV